MTKPIATRAIIKSHQMFNIFRLIAQGHSTTEACEIVGVDYEKYRLWVIENPDSIQAMQKTISAMERVSLLEITHAANAMLTRILRLANQDDLPPRTQLEIHSYLSKLTDDLESKHGTSAREDVRAKEFLLTGPKTRKAESNTTINIKPLTDGSVDVTVIKAEDIIDAIPMQEQP